MIHLVFSELITLYLQVISEGSEPGNNLLHVIHAFTHILQDILFCIVSENSTSCPLTSPHHFYMYVSPLTYFLLIFLYFSFILLLSFLYFHILHLLLDLSRYSLELGETPGVELLFISSINLHL